MPVRVPVRACVCVAANRRSPLRDSVREQMKYNCLRKLDQRDIMISIGMLHPLGPRATRRVTGYLARICGSYATSVDVMRGWTFAAMHLAFGTLPKPIVRSCAQWFSGKDTSLGSMHHVVRVKNLVSPLCHSM